MRFYLPLLSFFVFSVLASPALAEGYVGITPVSEYEAVEVEIPVPPKYGIATPPAPPVKQGATDKKETDIVKMKDDKLSNWTKNAYGLLNDGSQERYSDGLTKVYEEQVQEIRNGGLGYRPEYHKFKEKKMPKIEN